MLQVGPLKPVLEQSQLYPALPPLKHIPAFLQGVGKQGSIMCKYDETSKDYSLLQVAYLRQKL